MASWNLKIYFRSVPRDVWGSKTRTSLRMPVAELNCFGTGTVTRTLLEETFLRSATGVTVDVACPETVAGSRALLSIIPAATCKSVSFCSLRALNCFVSLTFSATALRAATRSDCKRILSCSAACSFSVESWSEGESPVFLNARGYRLLSDLFQERSLCLNSSEE